MAPILSERCEALLDRIDAGLDKIATTLTKDDAQQEVEVVALSKRLINHASILESVITTDDEVEWIESFAEMDIEAALALS